MTAVRGSRMRRPHAAAVLLLAVAIGGCASFGNGTSEPYVPTFDEWVRLTFETYAARLSHPGVYRIIWDGRGAGRFVFVSSLDPGELAFGESTIDSVLLGQVLLLADTVRRLSLEWSERGFAKDHTRVRFIVRFPPKRDIEVPVWDLKGEVRESSTL